MTEDRGKVTLKRLAHSSFSRTQKKGAGISARYALDGHTELVLLEFVDVTFDDTLVIVALHCPAEEFFRCVNHKI